MDLVSVAQLFDTTPMWDAYSGRLLKAKCQVTVWDNPRRDGLTTLRRTLSMSREAKLPTRRAVIIGGHVWLVSAFFNPDTWGAAVNRKGCVAQLAELGKVATTDQVLESTCESVYLSRVWVKDVKDITTSSEFQSQYYVYFSTGEQLEEGEFVFIKHRWHIIRNIYTATAGFSIAECNELERKCICSIEVDVGSYDPVTESISSEVHKVPVIQLDWRDDYCNRLPSAEPQQVGDIRFRTSRKYAHLLTEGSKFYFDGLQWTRVRVEHKNFGAVSVVLRRV